MKKYLMTAVAALALGGLMIRCTKDTDLYEGTAQSSQDIQKAYEAAFLSTFGKPVDGLNWGFGPDAAGTRAMTRNNPGVYYPETSTGINANANEWADAEKYYGGWVVPDPLTQPQKDLVVRYFQTHPNLTYEDPHFRHFFVQQVYKGGTSQVHDTTEGTHGADGTQYSSTNMNLLTVGYNEQHINNFNGGTYGVNGVGGAAYVNVLDKDQSVGGTSHQDQIMLMVNINDTECMGYHNTGSSQQVNNKAALVGWETIRDWARQEHIYTEDILNDGWDRSFVGFDLALKSLEDSYAKNNGNKINANYHNGPEGFQYVWDGTKVIPVHTVLGLADLDLISNTLGTWNNSETVTNNNNGTQTYNSVAWGGMNVWFSSDGIDLRGYQKVVVEYSEATSVATQLCIEIKTSEGLKQEKQYANAGVTGVELDLTGVDLTSVTQIALQTAEATNITVKNFYLKGQDVPFLDTNTNMYGGTRRTKDGGDFNEQDDSNTADNGIYGYHSSNGYTNVKCLNLPFIKKMLNDGYLPVYNKTFREWVKWSDSDGYYSDWIVTLSQAQRITDTPPPPSTPSIDPDPNVVMVVAEDLSTFVDNERKNMADFDFNDVVFEVSKGSNGVNIKLRAAGGTLPLTVGGKEGETVDNHGEQVLAYEVHRLFKVSTGTMVNTNASSSSATRDDVEFTIPYPVGVSPSDDLYAIANAIPIRVYREDYENNLGTHWIEIQKAQTVSGSTITASKLCVDTSYRWCNERIHIDKQFPYIDNYGNNKGSLFRMYLSGQIKGKWWKVEQQNNQ